MHLLVEIASVCLEGYNNKEHYLTTELHTDIFVIFSFGLVPADKAGDFLLSNFMIILKCLKSF